MSDLIIRIGGEGGEGIISAGDMVAEAAARSGLQILTFKTFPAEIRGGYAMYQVRFSKDKIKSEGTGFQVFCAFNKEALDKNRSQLIPGTVLVYDYPDGEIEEEVKIEGVTCYALPMSKIAKKDLDMYRAKNMVALGALSYMFDIAPDDLRELIKEKFGKKGQAVVDTNLKAIDAGTAYMKEHHKKTDPYKMGTGGAVDKNQIIISGNEAVGLGALLAGCNFLSCYPITPATEVAIYLSKALPKVGGVLVQAEDEIASLANVLGASYGGAKAMTSTSGPGLSLMQEMIGLAHMAELPCVIVDVQRGGPSTGLPTKHEQSDLFMAAHGGHGDASRVVLSAENVADAVDLTVLAFNIAEKYQTPVLLLTDGSLGFRTESIKRPDPKKYTIVNRDRFKPGNGNEPYLRYKLTESGVSPMSIPGEPGGAYISTGLEHSQSSSPSFTSEDHVKMSDKRFNKLDSVVDFVPAPEVQGEGQADVGVISWGSTLGVVREAVDMARAEGLKVKALHPKLVWPLQEKQIKAFAATCKKILVPEVNKQGQFAEILRGKTGIDGISYPVYGGMPFTPKQILDKIKEVL
ncbi:MAG: 2-oxoacid:acceptor oxidoreductase subunit alpha [Nitrospinae bacterium]|nr:2-oxoacid:acceptor oxidoreductase subunit alpha [Nitrospinota bacterium]